MRKCLTLAFLLILALSNITYTDSVEQSQAERADCHLFGGIWFIGGWFDYMFWTAGLDLDYHINNDVMITPDFWILNYQYSLAGLFNTGLAINFKMGNPDDQFFVGSGVNVSIPRGGADTVLFLKLNGGYLNGDIKVTVYLLTPFEALFEEDNVAFGANLGFTL